MNWPAISQHLYQSARLFGMDDFANALAYEVKQEIADRYFGFRTRIEHRCREYLTQLQDSGTTLTAHIQLDLCRMQFLLRDPHLFHTFLDLIGLPREIAADVCKRPLPFGEQELFLTLRGHGFTRWRRFRGLAIVVYGFLMESVAIYQRTFQEFKEEYTEISAEIDKFQQQNDLGEILSYLRQLDSPDAERLKFLHSDSALPSGKSLQNELVIAKPPPVENFMISLSLLPPLKQIMGSFRALLDQAYSLHKQNKTSQLPF
jgi:hypothetical protein